MFGDNPTHLKISAPKASHGHLLGGAGAIGVLSCIKAMQKQIVPPTINTTILDPNIPASFPIVLQKEMPHTIHTTMCNSFGFGGHNAIVICRKYVIE